MSEEAAHAALVESGISFRVIRHGPVRSLAEAAVARGVEPAAVVKTIVVRRGEGDFVFVLVPGDRTISWPKLRTLLGERRLSMPDAAQAKDVTGYERGTITPFGTITYSPGSQWFAVARASSETAIRRSMRPARRLPHV